MPTPTLAEFPFELWIRRLAVPLMLAAALAAYANSFSGPFIFDDHATIVENPTIRHLWPLGRVLSPPSDSGLTVNGRPLVNLSLALNYAVGGINPYGYHVFNFVLHLLAGLTLFGVIRRTLRQPALGGCFGHQAPVLALSMALIWLLHPLQTAAVSYIVQRAEVMVGLFYLLTLYSFIRSLDARHATIWKSVAIASCAAGMATKEVMVSAPLIVLLYDRTFIAGSFTEALGRRWRFHVALATTWLLLIWLILGSSGRGGTAGFGLAISPVDYAITQIGAISHYLRLAVWPHPLVFDYGGMVLVTHFIEVWPQAVLLALLLAGTCLALKRNHALGFAGTWFFVILAPSSSIVPLADTMFEHRMYLPLAAVIAAVCLAFFHQLKSKGVLLFLLIALTAGLATRQRNKVYQSELALWTDTVAKRPENVRAHYTLGSALTEHGRYDEALTQYRLSLELKSQSFEAHNNLGNLLTRTGHLDQAREHYETALAIRPNSADAHNNLGNVLLRSGRTFQAMKHYQRALSIDPEFADAHNNLGNLQMRLKHKDEAFRHYERALAAQPDFFDAHLNFANALGEARRFGDAINHYRTALALRPNSAEARYNLGVTFALAGRAYEAAVEFEETLRLAPDHVGARANLKALQSQTNR